MIKIYEALYRKMTSNNWKANLSLYIFFKVLTFKFHTHFMSFNPFIKCTFIPLFVKFFLKSLLWYIVDHLGSKISAHAVLSLQEEIKQYLYVQDPGWIGGRSSARAQNISSSIFKPVWFHLLTFVLQKEQHLRTFDLEIFLLTHNISWRPPPPLSFKISSVFGDKTVRKSI